MSLEQLQVVQWSMRSGIWSTDWVPLCSETGDFKFPKTVGLMAGF